MAKLPLKILFFVVYFNFISSKSEIEDYYMEEFNDVDYEDDEVYQAALYYKAMRVLLIMPGTKWCGDGDIASDYNDLGPSAQTDKCCRKHDHCTDYLISQESNLHCNCDVEFYKCLKAIGSKTSKIVGTMYFNILGTQCYKKSFPLLGCKKYYDAKEFLFFLKLYKKKCKMYTYNPKGEKLYQWFDVPLF